MITSITFFGVFVLEPLPLPIDFDGSNGLVRGHGSKTPHHSFTPGWELARKCVSIPNWCFGYSAGTGKVAKVAAFLTLVW
jgi:hypothetical protein